MWMVLFMGIGPRLKEKREEKEITLNQLQETTKIQKRYLKAIEEENFNALPGKFYTRAFIKEYANAVGLNVDELFEEFKDEIPSADDNQTAQYTRINRSRKDNLPTKNSKVFSMIPTIIVILLIIGIIFAAWWFMANKDQGDNDNTESEVIDNNEFYRPNTNTQDQEENDNESNESDQSDESETNGNGEDGQEEDMVVEQELELVEAGTNDSPITTYHLNNPDEPIIITFETETRSWLDVQDEDENSFYAAMVEANDSPLEIDVTGVEQIYLNIGSTPNLEVKINGITMDYVLDPNERDVQQFWVHVNQEETEE